MLFYGFENVEKFDLAMQTMRRAEVKLKVKVTQTASRSSARLATTKCVVPMQTRYHLRTATTSGRLITWWWLSMSALRMRHSRVDQHPVYSQRQLRYTCQHHRHHYHHYRRHLVCLSSKYRTQCFQGMLLLTNLLNCS